LTISGKMAVMKKYIAQSIRSGIVILWILAVSISAVAGLQTGEIDRLQEAGLSPETIASVKDLHQMQNGQRPPLMTVEEIFGLLDLGMTDELIGQMVQLDRMTRHQAGMPISPKQIRVLLEAGINTETIRLLLRSEIHRLSVPSDPGMTGRETIVRPDGRKVIVYRSGATSQVGQKVITYPDGRKIIIDYSGHPNAPVMSIEEQQERQLKRALDLLERLQLHIYR